MIDPYFAPLSDNLYTYLVKVDYGGELEVIKKAELAGYNKMMMFDAISTDSFYIFMATATSISSGFSYFMTIRSTKTLDHFKIVDSEKIDYPHFGLYQYNTIFNINTAHHELVFTIGNGYNQEKAAMSVAIDQTGKIQKLKQLNLSDKYVNDHFYNAEVRKHYIMSASHFYELDEDFNLLREANIYVMLGNVKKYNFDYRILYASDEEIYIVGIWPDTGKFYVYKIKLRPDGGFDPIEYNPDFFPGVKSYILRKQYFKDNIIVSFTTDLDTPVETPNICYLLQMDKFGKIEKQYRIEDEYKKSLEISDIDDQGNLLGWGFEQVTNNSLFFILSEDNRFLVGSDDEAHPNNQLKIYPNPTNGIFKIELPEHFRKGTLVITDVTAKEVMHREVKYDGSGMEIDMSSYPDGVYHIKLFTGENNLKMFYEAQVVKVK